ncbi:MAG: DUF3108 domain-containing protein [Candidatus Kapabacteria bacterium]|nr:DUF3108 domain-containing protein [Candidatus Kapabacteria bacterium]
MFFKVLKISIVFLSLFFFSSAYSLADFSPIISVGEELTYEVSFFGIKLGTIRILTEENQTLNNKTVHKAKCFINSYKGIPFVDLQVIYQSWMDPSLVSSHKFASNTKDGSSWVYEQIDFNTDEKKIVHQKYYDKELISNNTFITSGRWNDGLSLFFAARRLLNSNRSLKIPTYMDDTVYTKINFTGKKENVEIAAVKYPIKCVYFKGMADWTGVYGLTGSFEGWFSDDEAAVPIKALMKVYVGNVKIELIKWKRANWQPPRG